MTKKTCPDCQGKGSYKAVAITGEVVECICITYDGTGKISKDEN